MDSGLTWNGSLVGNRLRDLLLSLLIFLCITLPLHGQEAPLSTAQETLSSIPFDREALASEVSSSLKNTLLVDVIVTLVQPDSVSGGRGLGKAQRQADIRARNHAAEAEVLAKLSVSEFSERYRFDNFAGFSGSVTKEGFEKLLAHPSVLFIEPVRILEEHLAQGIPLMNATTVRSSYNGSGMAIAVCDTGIDYTHPRLGAGTFPNSKVIGGYDFGDSDADPIPNTNAHGTCCAGITAGDLGTVGSYIGGVAYNARLYALKISYGSGGSATNAAMIAAWDWCVTHQNDNPSTPIMVISTSFGGGRYYSTATGDAASPGMTTAANNAVAAGITVLASSGNDGYCDSMGWPACISSVISVGAVYDANFGTYNPCVNAGSCAPKISTTGCATGWYVSDATAPDKVTAYSNTASFLTLLAPANACYTTDITGSSGYSSGDYYTSFGGTSAACPYAAGAVACLQSAAQALLGRYLTVAEVRSTLTSTGVNITDTKVPITKPRIDLDAAVASMFSTFSWAPVSSPQYVGAPFGVTVTAVDALGQPVAGFNGTVDLSGFIFGSGVEVTIGTGANTWNYPLSTYYHDARTQVIYLAGELGGARTLDTLSLYVDTVPGQTMGAWTIRMKYTGLSAYSSADWEGTGWTTVYQADQTISSNGWTKFTFSTPFEYDGVNNLMIDFSFNNTSWTSDGQCRYSTPGGNRSVYYRTDSNDGDPLTWSGTTPSGLLSTNVPNIILGSLEIPVSISPTVSESFVNGVWSGSVTVLETASGMVLRADDGSGHGGDSILFDVERLTPEVTTWPTASDITYGQSLADSILSGGAASAPGSFAFTNPGLTPNAGTEDQSVTFTPTDTARYNSVVGATSVTVNPATPMVTAWPVASDITYGQTLADSELSGGSASVPGSFQFTDGSIMPEIGEYNAEVIFVPDDLVNYSPVTGNAFVTVLPAAEGEGEPCVEIQAYVYLEGALIDSDGSATYNVPMRTDLNDLLVLPGQTYEDLLQNPVYSPPGQPYSVAPWFYNGTEGDGFDSGGDPDPGDAGYPDTVVDWVLVSLRADAGGTGGPLCQAAALLHNDGRIEFIGSVFSCCDLDLNSPYYLVVEHLNHLIVMSHEPIGIVGNTLTYDFRNQQSYLDDPFGFGAVRQKEIQPNVFAMFGGNGQQLPGVNDDTDITFGDQVFWDLQNGLFGLYLPGDYNLNGDVSFNDRTLWEINNSRFTSVTRN